MQSKFEETYRRLQIPLQELVQLNLRTIRHISYIKPEDWLRLRKPQDIFEKQIHIFIENGHKALDYMQEAVVILEKNWFSATAGVGENYEQSMLYEAALMNKRQKTAKRKTKIN